MNSEELDSRAKLLARVSELLDDLGPFTSATPREDKWRTTEQLAHELELFGSDETDRIDQVLRGHEAECLERLERGLPAEEAVIRRAKYPDRTTALPLWGSVKHLGPPWVGHRPDRTDPPDDVPASLRVRNSAPQVFLSHTHQDVSLALRLAEALAAMEIGSWRFETHIDQRGVIADCVKHAIDETACLVALVTRHSIASLWVLTELQTSLRAGVPVALVVNTDDALLLQLLQTVRFPDIEWRNDFYLPVKYDQEIAALLEQDYAARETESRAKRYRNQMHDFLATLPLYLGSIPPGKEERVWRAALSFPRLPAEWSGVVKLGELAELRSRIDEHASGSC